MPDELCILALDSGTKSGWALVNGKSEFTSGVQEFALQRGESAVASYISNRRPTVKKWRLTAKVVIEDTVQGETKIEALALAVDFLRDNLGKPLSKDAKIVITSTTITEQK